MNWPTARVVRDKLFEFARYAAIGGGVYFLATHFVRHSSGPKEGSTAAAFDLPLAGKDGRVSLATQHGKPMLIEVFASWCGACKRSSPRLAEAWREHHDQDVTFLAVSVDEDPAAAARVKRDWQLPFDVAVDDGSISRGYGISMLPTLIYIDAQGTVRHSAAGVVSRSEIDSWLAER
ncbi:MAG TPA: TlpA disulfide reductase family protein [Polyangiaceae bacterium]|nr:TlpA disulfide reductase family protein [Polyangiaceae bacterium]